MEYVYTVRQTELRTSTKHRQASYGATYHTTEVSGSRANNGHESALRSVSNSKDLGSCLEKSRRGRSPSQDQFSNSIVTREQKEPPKHYPEYTASPSGRYIYTSHDFWTSGFFPGSLYLLHERQKRWPGSVHTPNIHPLKLRHACEWWTANLHSQAPRTDTHDLGFMIMPWAELGWELDHDRKCYESIVAAAYSLASRFNERIGAIRSWDTCMTQRYSFTDLKDAFLVIIDSMMSM